MTKLERGETTQTLDVSDDAVEAGRSLQDASSISLEDHRDYLMGFLDNSLVKRKRDRKKWIPSIGSAWTYI